MTLEQAASGRSIVHRPENDFIEYPASPDRRQEPVIRGKGVPVWILRNYSQRRGMTPVEISALWEGVITEAEIKAALAYAAQYPELIEDRLAFEDEESAAAAAAS